MFKTIILRRQNQNDEVKPVDLGFLAEAMLFYEDVHLLADYGIVQQLVRYCSSDIGVLFALMDEGFLKIDFLESVVAVKTLNTGTPSEIHSAVIATTDTWKLQNAAPIIFQDVLEKSGLGRRKGNQFARRVHPISHDKELPVAIREDYTNKKYIEQACKLMLHTLAPEYQISPDFRFNVQIDDERLIVDTNLDFATVDGRLQLRTPSGFRDISPAKLLVTIFDARCDLHFASLYEGEIATSRLTSALIQAKCQELLSTRIRDEQRIELFQDFVLSGHTIGEVINAGERNYKDLLKLLQRARKIRKWLQQKEPDIDLAKAYYEEVTAKTWVETLPAKGLRWAIQAAIAAGLMYADPLIGLGVTTGLATIDTFLLERLVRGWRPNQFIEGPLERFVQQPVHR